MTPDNPFGNIGVRVYSDTGRRECVRNQKLRRLCPWCRKTGVRRTSTHAGLADGGCMLTACKWHVMQWVRNPRAVM